MAFNIVELASTGADCANDQPCKFGHRVEGHAVYCHADHWAESPRKCHRTWYSSGKVKDEDCVGFQPNPDFDGELNPTPIVDKCSQCKGKKYLSIDGQIETCPRCMGSGEELKRIYFTQAEENVLATDQFSDDWYVSIAVNQEQSDAIKKLTNLNCLICRSVQFVGKAEVYLVKRTLKGKVLLHLHWGIAEEHEAV